VVPGPYPQCISGEEESTERVEVDPLASPPDPPFPDPKNKVRLERVQGIWKKSPLKKRNVATVKKILELR
jgi:hypothetical protein